MPRREREKELARRRKRREKRKKLRAKGLLPPPNEVLKGGLKEPEKKQPERPASKETPVEVTKEEILEKPS
jgi:hypothetical protein